MSGKNPSLKPLLQALELARSIQAGRGRGDLLAVLLPHDVGYAIEHIGI